MELNSKESFGIWGEICSRWEIWWGPRSIVNAFIESRWSRSSQTSDSPGSDLACVFLQFLDPSSDLDRFGPFRCGIELDRVHIARNYSLLRDIAATMPQLSSVAAVSVDFSAEISKEVSAFRLRDKLRRDPSL